MLDADLPDRRDREVQLRGRVRHLLAHKMGVVDEDYLKKAIDPGAIIGRKVSVSSQEVTATLAIVETLGKRLFHATLGPRP